MTLDEALNVLEPKLLFPPEFNEALSVVKDAMNQYRAIGTVEELQKAEKEENILKFYYCDSEDNYLVGLRIDNFYYAHYIDGRWVFDMSRHLPWGKHVVDDATAWKEYTYPSEPREISFSEWLNGFIKKECGGTPDECRTAVEKQIPKKIVYRKNSYGTPYLCPVCEAEQVKTEFFDSNGSKQNGKYTYCWGCGSKIDWRNEE